MEQIRGVLDKLYWRLVARLVPGLVNAQRRYIRKLTGCLEPGKRWLDLGCGTGVVPRWIPEADELQAHLDASGAAVVGIDCDGASLSRITTIAQLVQGEAGRLPFKDGSFDLVTANMVVEHIEHPQRVLREVGRVLGPDGAFLFQTPNVFNPFVLLAMWLPQALKNAIARLLHGRAAEDMFPTFYRMNRAGTIKRLARDAGLTVREVRLVESSAETAILGPLVVPELLFIRFTRLSAMQWLRSDIIAVLHKPSAVQAPQASAKSPTTRMAAARPGVTQAA
jgi:ubiquinone/menaquinone biosynthesis C-methylase UbiE